MRETDIAGLNADTGTEGLDGVIAIIPSLNPDERLVKIASELKEAGFGGIVIVNDGSGAESSRFFEQAALSGATVLTHNVNRGKGRALKTAFEHIILHTPSCKAVVTVDGDGQHSAPDSAKVAAHTVLSGTVTLGVRNFDLSHVPKRSIVGNKLTRGLFRVVFGIKISDTQTGLRGFPSGILPVLTQIEGERFEYETNMLLKLHRANVGFSEVPIETLYMDNNATSHYRAFADSFRIFTVTMKFLTYSLSSLASALIDNAAFYILSILFAQPLGRLSVTAAFALARLISSLFNFTVNKKIVFRSGGGTGKTALRYYMLALAQFLAGNTLLNIIAQPLELSAGITTLVKILIDTALFIISFHIQRKWVFGK